MENQKKICVVGAGSWGKNHIKTLDMLGALGGVVEKRKEIISNINKQYPGCKTFESLLDAIRFGFDGYIISTPPSTHFRLAKKVIINKKPVLIEKPLTLDYASAFKLNELAKKEDVNLMVGHVLLFHPAFMKMKELIDSGVIGEIQYIYSNRLNLGTFRRDENVFWSFAPHDISLFNYFFNESPIKINSNGVDILQKNIHDTTITSFQYRKNKMGHIFVSWLHPFKEHRFVIIGSKGMLRFEDSVKNKPLTFYNKSVEYINDIPSPKVGESKRINYKNTLPLTNELKYFISKIDSGKIEISSGDNGCEVIKILEEASKSLSNTNMEATN